MKNLSFSFKEREMKRQQAVMIKEQVRPKPNNLI